MGSIFNTSYSEAIRRVQADAEAKKPAAGAREKGDTRFSEILSSLESKKQHEVDTSARASLDYGFKQPQESRPEGDLSNLSFQESLQLKEESFHALNTQRAGIERYSLSKSELILNNEEPSNPLRLAPKSEELPKVAPQGIDEVKPKPPAPPKIVSVRRSYDSPPAPVLPAPKHPALTEEALEQIIGAAGRHHGVDPSLSVAVAKAESSLRTDAVSSDGHKSKGIFQLLDTTGKEMMQRLDAGGKYNPFDPQLNAHLGVGYLRRLHDLFSKETNLGFNLKTEPAKSASDLEKFSVAAFNAGEGNVARAQRLARREGKDPSSYDAIAPHLPASTRTYVERVLALKTVQDAQDDETSVA